jgi:hypothetical protein
MLQKLNDAIAVIGIDISKNSFHLIGQDKRGAIVLRQKWSRGQVEARLANPQPCLIGMEACVGAHHLSRKLQNLDTSVGCVCSCLPLLLLPCDGHRKRKRRALPNDRVQPDSSAMHLDDALRNREPQASAALFARNRIVGLLK